LSFAKWDVLDGTWGEGQDLPHIHCSCPRVPHSALSEPRIDGKSHKLKGTEEKKKVVAFLPFYDIIDISFPRIQFQVREFPLLLRLKLNALCSTLPQSNPPVKIYSTCHNTSPNYIPIPFRGPMTTTNYPAR